MGYFLLGLLVLGMLVLFGHWFARANTHEVAQGVRTFAAVFSGLASTGLLFTGRFGLALITIGAMIMAIRAMREGRRGADPLEGGRAADPVEVETGLLRMRLDRSTGEVDGMVTDGRFAGRELGTLELGELLELLEEAGRRDPQSTGLLEAYLDRRFPDWRETGRDGRRGAGSGRAGPAADDDMDEAQALSILGLERGAQPEEIKQAHRRLMAKLHPDRGGSTFLATQINRAKDLLLEKLGSKRH